MPQPLPTVRSIAPLVRWPASVPAPQSESLRAVGPPRVEVSDVLTGPVRLRVKARTAPMQWTFSCFLTALQMQAFEAWYRDCVEVADGEFYAPWIGGSRVVAFSAPYELTALGTGYVLSGQLIRTRIDLTACDDALEAAYGNILRDDGSSIDVVIDDAFALPDAIVDDYDLQFVADHEC